jgi:hypothetical protein
MMSMSGDVTQAVAPLVNARACGSCTLCCKLFPVEDLAKPAGVWCNHIAQGKGCSIYASAPNSCRTFSCLWQINATLGPEWKPDHARFVMISPSGSEGLIVRVDPGAAGAWRKEPYYSQLKQWARAALLMNGYVMVLTGQRATILLPASDVDVGILGPQDEIEILNTNGAFSVRVVTSKAAG